jgi:hypothetical protein
MNGILIKPYFIPKIVAGEKYVTRRLDQLKEINLAPDKWKLAAWDNLAFLFECHGSYYVPDGYTLKLKPRYHVDEVVYVKEAYTYVTLAEKDPWKDRAIADGSFRRKPDGSPVTMCYKLDGYEIPAKWETPLFMPAWAARHFIQITDNRPERLQDITEEEAKREGASCHWNKGELLWEEALQKATLHKWKNASIGSTYKFGFQILWDSINPDYPFDSNPYVFRYAFKYLPDYKYEGKPETAIRG